MLYVAEERPIRCYHKLAHEDQEPELLYCGYHDDICVHATLKHEDGERCPYRPGLHLARQSCTGEFHVSQYCANSSSAAWWLGDQKCRAGTEGGLQCGCSQSGYTTLLYLVCRFFN